MRTTMLIKARLATDLGMPNATGYRLCGVNPGGKMEIEEGSYPTSRAAYDDAKLLWPANSTWRGRRVSGGYRIQISSPAPLSASVREL